MKLFKLYINELKKLLSHKFILVLSILFILLFGAGSFILDKIDLFNNDYYHTSTMEINGKEYARTDMAYNFRNFWDMTYHIDIEDHELNNVIPYIIDYYEKYTPTILDDNNENIGIGDPFQDPTQYLAEKYFLDNNIILEENVENIEILSYLSTSLIEISKINEDNNLEQKQLLIDQNNFYFENAKKIYENNDYEAYYNYLIYDTKIKTNKLKEEYKQLEEQLANGTIDYDLATESLDNIKNDIELNNTLYIPIYEYRLKSKTYINNNDWKDNALSKILDDYESKIKHPKLLTKAEFGERENYSYEDYKLKHANRLIQYDIEIDKGVRSLKSNEPAMEFVMNSSRENIYDYTFITYIYIVFAILVGAYQISSEFNNGTIKLLLIRPITRIKLYTLKFLSGYTIIFICYILTMLLAFICVGINNGFSDYMYPYYTDYGTTNFIFKLTTDIIKCSSIILFMYSIAYCCSSIFRNIAVSIILPVIYYISTLFLGIINNISELSHNIIYNPTTYTFIPELLEAKNTYYLRNFYDHNIPISVELGVIVLSISSIILLTIGAIVFNKKDITN